VENPLHEANEQIEHLEEAPESRLKVVITVAILVVTMLTTGAGVLAAIWSAHQSETQRERQQAATKSLEEGLTVNSQLASVDSAIDDSTEAQWRRTFLTVYSMELSDRSLVRDLKRQADAAQKVAGQIDARLPKGARDSSYSDRLNQDSTTESELAAAYARESAGWLEKHNGALSVVSMLALSLFLLGLALTLGNRPTQIGFTGLAMVMTLIAAARLVQIDGSTIKAPTEDCIRTAAQANAFVVDTQYKQAEGKLQTALATCPSYGEAWSALGQARFYQGAITNSPAAARQLWPRAQQADQHALDVADTKSGELYNDLAFMQMLNHDYAAAQANLAKARELSPQSNYVLGSLAELAVARGDDTTAERLLREAALRLKDAGPYLRNSYFFASLRDDHGYFKQAGITGPKVDTFFLHAREYEALLDSGAMSSPLDTHGAGITDLVFRRSRSVLGHVAKAVTIGFRYHGLKPGDVIALRFYGYQDTTYDTVASFIQRVDDGSPLLVDGVEKPDSHFRVTLASQYETTLEVYLNGILQGETTYTP
jgi:tetratricopeptide (TPR) repeat protein